MHACVLGSHGEQDALGWSKGKRERLLDAFRAITSSPHMTFHHFAAFLSTQGVSLKFAVPLFRAFDRRQHGEKEGKGKEAARGGD